MPLVVGACGLHVLEESLHTWAWRYTWREGARQPPVRRAWGAEECALCVSRGTRSRTDPRLRDQPDIKPPGPSRAASPRARAWALGVTMPSVQPPKAARWLEAVRHRAGWADHRDVRQSKWPTSNVLSPWGLDMGIHGRWTRIKRSFGPVTPRSWALSLVATRTRRRR